MKWDYIVVGAGSAGCALAYELANSHRNASVLVLEAGGSDRSLDVKVPALVRRTFDKFDWGYRAEPDPSRYGVKQRWLRGRVLGGSSSINSAMYVRGPSGDFDRWSDLCAGQGGWSGQEVMSIFREFEKSDQPGGDRGTSGPLYVRTVRQPHAVTRAFIKSACAAGYAFNEDYNGKSQEGMSTMQFNQRRGLRWSSADAFLRPVLREGRVRLLLHALVEKVEMVDSRATAVLFRHKRERRRETARHIILCAGAINSPQLLMLSGIGCAEDLRRCGVDVVRDIPAVGRNLRDHQYLYMLYRTRIPTYNLTGGLLQRAQIFAKYLCGGEGPIASPFEGAAFLRSDATASKPDIQLFFSPFGLLKKETGSFNLAPFPSVGVVLANSYPVSSGRVRLASNRPEDPPLIDYELLGSPIDVEAMVRGLRTIRKIMAAQPIASLIESEITPGLQVNDPPALEAFIRKTTAVCLHTIGTCTMGIGEDTVVGPDLRVHGIENLWVADASIMPAPLSSNTGAACMMIGAKLGKQLAARP